jgi:hypothetical protein
MFNKSQFKDLVERALKEKDLHSESAVQLVMGTVAQESNFGTYLRQTKGPARGVSQMELPTFRWLQNSVDNKHPWVNGYSFEELEWDLKAAILFCRLRYLVDKQPLPAAGDTQGQAKYYKRVYNTIAGKATVEQYLENYKRYCC